MNDADRALTQLAARQRGVFTRSQARDVGLTPTALSRRLSRGDLVPVGTATLRYPGHVLTWLGRLTAGLLDLGPAALVTGRSAARLLGLDGFTDDAVEFLVPRELRNRSTVGLVTSTRQLTRLDRIVIDGLPCTSATRTVVELLRLGSVDDAARALDSASRSRLTAHAAVRRRLDELGRQGRAGVDTFEQLTRIGSVESWLERRFVEVVVRAGLPRPQLQQRHELDGIGVARVDFEYPLWGVVVEVGGQRGYLSCDERQRQERRRNALQLDGRTIYFFTHDDVVHHESYVLTTIARALGVASHDNASRPA